MDSGKWCFQCLVGHFWKKRILFSPIITLVWILANYIIHISHEVIQFFIKNSSFFLSHHRKNHNNTDHFKKSFLCTKCWFLGCFDPNASTNFWKRQYLIWVYLYTNTAPHSSILAWKIPWMEEPGRLWSMGSLRVGHDWATSLSLFTFMHWRRTWQPTPVFLPG